MEGPSVIPVEAVIRKALDNGVAFLVTLPNGKEIIAHFPKGVQPDEALDSGRRVTLELTPYDFSSGRIVKVHSCGTSSKSEK
ncbi:MAG: translation initiation factor IF-1 [Verrucomicrobiota bacterium]